MSLRLPREEPFPFLCRVRGSLHPNGIVNRLLKQRHADEHRRSILMFAPWIPLAHGRAIHSEVVAAALLRIAAQTQLRRPFLALHTRPARQCHTRFGVPPAQSSL